MRCLVTGASGHLGARLAERLVDEGAQVWALVRPESDLWRLRGVLGRIRLVHGDLSDIPAAGIRDSAPEAVFHLGWYGVTAAFRNAPEQITRNVRGSLDLFEAVRAAGTCRAWIGVGSQAEYGRVEGIAPLREEMPARPVTNYGVAKHCVALLTERLCALAEMRFVWLRLLATYGPRDDERHLIPAVIRHLLAGKRPAMTAGEQRWDYLYVDDAVEALWQAVITASAQGVFNLGSGEAHRIREIVERIRDGVDPALPLGLGEVPYRPDQGMYLRADITRLRGATGWTPRTDLDEGLRRTIDWYRANPAAKDKDVLR